MQQAELIQDWEERGRGVMAEGIETPCVLDFLLYIYGKWLLPKKGFSMYSSKAGGQNVRQ